MEHTPTPTAVKAKIDAMLASGGDRLAYLCDRWSDEQEYEDWSEYVAQIKAIAPEGITITRITKRPFGFEFTCAGMPDARYSLFANASSVGWKRLKQVSA